MTINPEATPRPDYSYVPGTDVPEPTAGREADYRPWEAPPTLASSSSVELSTHQYDVYEMIMALVHGHMPTDMPASTKSLVLRHVMPREGADVVDYQGNHEASLVLLPELELNDEELEIHRMVQIGTATMEQIRANMKRLGRKSAELAMLRVIAGHRAEYKDPMIEELAALLGAKFNVGKPRKYRIIGYDDNFLRHEDMAAIAFESKQSYVDEEDENGDFYDSRQVHVVRTDPASGFNQEVREAIQFAAEVDTTHISRLKRVKEVFDDIATVGPSHELVAASSIKLYIHNAATARTLAARDRVIARDQRKAQQFDSTQIYFKNLY